MLDNSVETGPYETRRWLAQTLDPVHVGTGEFQLGRVDNTIVREAGSNLPKIPGSSLAGVARAYTAMEEGRYPSCAGKSEENGRSHCSKSSCPVCMAFGYATGRHSFQGLAQFSDARLLFFPVYTLLGPLWVTSPGTLQAAGVNTGTDWLELDQALRGADHEVALPEGLASSLKRVNLGWIYLKTHDKRHKATEWTWPDHRLDALPILKPMLGRAAIVDDQLFPIIVEDQLEVRTTVSIDPETGAAAEGALFTTEALPRASFLYFDVTVMNPRYFTNPSDRAKLDNLTAGQLHGSTKKGLGLIEYLGLGGSNTRGMGRIRVEEIR
jgi:CRISPR-associated protein Cmr4